MDQCPAGNERLLAAILECLESAERGAPVDPGARLADEPHLAAELHQFLKDQTDFERLLYPIRHLLRHFGDSFWRHTESDC
jgi:hypothetical protein